MARRSFSVLVAPALLLLLRLPAVPGRLFDFGHVKYSNLGGHGPDTDALDGIRYIDVAMVNGSAIDMIVVEQGATVYTPQDASKNGVRDGYGVINMKAGTHAILTFKLFRPDTRELVAVDQFFFTVLNICGSSEEHLSQVTVSDFAGVCLPSNTRLTRQLRGKDLVTLVSGGSVGVNQNTPEAEIKPECAATFLFRSASTFSVRFEVAGQEADVGQNFLISGTPLPECLPQFEADDSEATDTANGSSSAPTTANETASLEPFTATSTTTFTATVILTTPATSTSDTLTATATFTSASTASTTLTTTEPYDCHGERPWRWDRDAQSWCCEHHNVGCHTNRTDEHIPDDKAVKTCRGSEHEVVICSGIPECDVCEPRDCAFTDWNDWSVLQGCVGLCSRMRSIKQTSNTCGSPCKGPRVETSAAEGCLPEECHQASKDCRWADWSDWSDCSGGDRDVKQSFRSRDVAQFPEGDGEQCHGPSNETKSCANAHKIDCQLSEWGDWTTCSVTCGGGWQATMRRITQPAVLGGKACHGSMRRALPCNEQPCGPAGTCEFDEWESWVGCNPSSPHQKRRSRTVLSAPQDATDCSKPVQEVAPCDTSEDRPRLCELAPWEHWTSCTAECEGQRFRRRDIAEGQPHNCFLEAADTVEETVPCGKPSCDKEGKDCEMGLWAEWGECSQECGVGIAVRSREVLNPGTGNGLGCAGDLEEVKACMVKECLAVDCQWADWEPWGACTRTCGGGNMRRVRTVKTAPENGGALCAPEEKAEVVPCGTQSCEHCVDGAWSSWDDWMHCSAECGGGIRARHREVARRPSTCGKPAVGLEDEYEVCNNDPCESKRDCELSAWTEWSACSSDCYGVRDMSRHVVQYASGGGETCKNDSLKVVQPCRPSPGESPPDGCGVEPPASCRMAAWEDWGSCSAKCGGGQKRRVRNIESPNHDGGAPCDESTSEVVPCGTEPCGGENSNDCEWGQWTPWSDCQCSNGGQRYRHRIVARQAKEGGRHCEAGPTKEAEPCESSCEQVYYCTWSDWSGLGGCSADCGHASQMRQRSLVLTKHKPETSSLLFEGSYDLSCAGSQINVSMCPYVDCAPECEPQDCLFDDWSDWTEPTCLQLCERHRVIKEMDSCGGKSCNGSLMETKRCGKDCTVTKDCEMSDWGAWEPPECTRSGEQRYRTREIVQAPTELGKPCTGPINETVACIVPDPKPVDCALSPWVSWSECTRTCDGGLRRRARSIANVSEFGGKPCNDTLEQLEPCGTDRCHHDAVPCRMGAWSNWGRCDSMQMRTRQRRVKQLALDQGAQCYGATKETEPCRDAVDCVVSDWTAWDECDAECGGGQQQRQRMVVQNPLYGGAECTPDLVEMRGCNDLPCGDDSKAKVGEWADWSTCDANCGAGSMGRTRNTEGPFSGTVAQAASCEGPSSSSESCKQPVDCKWGDWADWKRCSATCNGGQRERKREIAQMPKLGGRHCDARHKVETEPCGVERCYHGECVDGKWGKWQQWSDCSQTCDGGVSFRSRHVAREANRCGEPVTGFSIEHKACNADVPCIENTDCKFTDWSDWSKCAAECSGVRHRTRKFDEKVTGEGKSCKGHLKQLAPCMSPGADCGKAEPVDCQLDDWDSWGDCDVTCGGGQKTRSRDIVQMPSGMGAACEEHVEETHPCWAAVRCKSDCNATDCVMGDWDDWSACKTCGGEKRRSRDIKKHSKCGGHPCHKGAFQEIEKCPRLCHGQTYCTWGDWTKFTECSATCGHATKERFRNLTRVEMLEPEADEEGSSTKLGLEAKYDQLHERARGLGDTRRRQLALAWGAGMLGLVALMATNAAFRSRGRLHGERSSEHPERRRGLLGDYFDGYAAAPQMSPPSSPIADRLPRILRR